MAFIAEVVGEKLEVVNMCGNQGRALNAGDSPSQNWVASLKLAINFTHRGFTNYYFESRAGKQYHSSFSVHGDTFANKQEQKILN